MGANIQHYNEYIVLGRRILSFVIAIMGISKTMGVKAPLVPMLN